MTGYLELSSLYNSEGTSGRTLGLCWYDTSSGYTFRCTSISGSVGAVRWVGSTPGPVNSLWLSGDESTDIDVLTRFRLGHLIRSVSV